MNKKVRTRIAPSPTGYATIGNIRTALFCYLFAKKHGGEFLLRIEDTDTSRFVPDAEKYIIDSLKWLGISPDDGVDSDGNAKYRQSEREYKSFAKILLDSGHAYYAFDNPYELDALRKNAEANKGKFSYNSVSRIGLKNSLSMSVDELKVRLDAGDPYVIRFKTPENQDVVFTDLVKGVITFNTKNMDDKILFKSDGNVAFHLANVVDDYKMEITHVIRGEEWVSSTPLHILLYEAFGWDKPAFCHLPLVLGPDGKKLSKRKMKEYGFPVFPLNCRYNDDKGNVVDVVGFKDLDYYPHALINFLSLLGWNPGGTQEIMTMDEMISLFDIDRVNSSGAIFDIEKLKSFNAHYLRVKDNDYLLSVIVKSLWHNLSKESVKTYSESELPIIINIAKERATFEKDLYSFVSYFFEPIVLSDVILKNDSEFRNIMNDYVSNPCNRVIWTADGIKGTLESLCDKSGFKIGKILPDLRMALTGGVPGPDLPTVMSILGPDESFNRIKNLLMKTEKVAS